MDKTMTKTEMVRKHLLEVGEISEVDALREYEVTTMPRIIYRLQKEGMSIRSKVTPHRNRFGDQVSITRYLLLQGE